MDLSILKYEVKNSSLQHAILAKYNFRSDILLNERPEGFGKAPAGLTHGCSALVGQLEPYPSAILGVGMALDKPFLLKRFEATQGCGGGGSDPRA